MEFYLYNLSNLCRICLSKTDTMSKLFDLSNGLYDVLKSIVNIELEENETFPNYLCSNCADRINICQEVINKCKQTNEFLQRCKQNDFKVEDDKVTLETFPIIETIELTDQSDDNTDTFVERCKQNDIKTEENKITLGSPLKSQTTEFTTQNDDGRGLLLQRYNHCDFKVEDTEITLGSILQTQAVDFNTVNEDSIRDLQEAESDNPVRSRKPRLKQYSVVSVIQEVEILKKKLNSIRKCVSCNFQGRSFRALSAHMSHIHKDIKSKWCPTCNMIFENIGDHWVTTHHENENTCNFCKRNLSSHSHLVEHLIGHANFRPYKCSVCYKTFASMRYLRLHFRSHLRQRPFVCKFCDTVFTHAHLLKIHLEKLHSCTSCPGCRHIFTTQEAFMQHKCVQADDDNPILNVPKQNYCTICKRNVRSLSVHNRTFHERCKEDDVPVMKLCTVCGKQFKNNYKLRIHMRVHTGETPYCCSYCNRKMTTRHHLVLHERTHTGEKPYVCPVCKKAFTQRSILNTHSKLHMGRPEKCMLCEKSFCRPAELKIHMRKHTGERPYNCSLCEKNFAQRSHLVEHARRHTNDKPFKCDFCGKAFRQRSALKTHVNIHLGEKPFKCTYCSYACRQSYRLTVHMRQHAKGENGYRPNQCSYCSRVFSSQAALDSHVSNVHLVCLS